MIIFDVTDPTKEKWAVKSRKNRQSRTGIDIDKKNNKQRIERSKRRERRIEH